MRVLCVAPNPSGSGEAITASAILEALAGDGHEVRAFAHPGAARFFAPALRVDPFADSPDDTAQHWQGLRRDARPDLVLFADYPLLQLSHHGRALLAAARQDPDDGATMVTLDHLGLAQGPLTIGFGPPHLELLPEHVPAVPAGMRILLPCPVQSPIAGNRMAGERCRYGDAPAPLSQARRDAIRARYLRHADERLILHSTPGWATGFCDRHGLPQPRHQRRLLSLLLDGLPVPLTVVSVGSPEPDADAGDGWRLVWTPSMPSGDYEALLLASDLVISDNRVSVGLGKAAYGGVPAVAVRNRFTFAEIVERGGPPADVALTLEAERTGSVFPFDVFPIWARADVETLGVFDRNPLDDCVTKVELFGGDETRRTIAALLTDEDRRRSLRESQETYRRAVMALPMAHELLAQMI